MSDFLVIDGDEGARNLAYATWLRSYEANSLAAKHVPRDLFFAEHHRILDSIFARGPTFRVAVVPEERDVVLGWSVSEGNTLHYVYVKPAFRRHGIALHLTAHLKTPFLYTHWTHALRELHPRLERCIFNPYALHRTVA